MRLYNKENDYGLQPVFCAKSSSAVILFLEAFQEDLELVRRSDGLPLLYHCIGSDIANEEVISAMSEQLERKWNRWTPLEQGDIIMHIQNMIQN